MRMTDLRAGWVVAGNDGRRLGTIREVSQNYVLVSTSRLSEDLHVPVSAIANVEGEVVHLNLSMHEAESMGWAQPPRDEDALEAQDPDLHRHV